MSLAVDNGNPDMPGLNGNNSMAYKAPKPDSKGILKNSSAVISIKRMLAV